MEKLINLQVASEYGFADIVSLLLLKGVNVNEQDKNGTTALMCAARGGCTEVTRLLVTGGADLDLKDNAGNTAFDHAMDNGNLNTAEYLFIKSYLIKEHNLRN